MGFCVYDLSKKCGKREKKYSNCVDCILDKIRAEIADLDDADYDYEGYYKAVTDALQIIDKFFLRPVKTVKIAYIKSAENLKR